MRERERERERETDRSDVTIVAPKLAMSLHFPLPNIRTIAMSSHFPMPKIRFFRFSLHTSRLSFLNGHHFGAELRNEFTLFVAKTFRPLVPTLSNGASCATSDRKPNTNDQILPGPILFFPWKKMNQINTKNYWK